LNLLAFTFFFLIIFTSKADLFDNDIKQTYLAKAVKGKKVKITTIKGDEDIYQKKKQTREMKSAKS